MEKTAQKIGHVRSLWIIKKNILTSLREGDLSVLDINYLVGTPEETIFFKEKHELGLFDDSDYRRAFEVAGLTTEYDKEGLFGRGMYIGIKN